VSAFIDSHRDRFGVEPICRVLGVSASAYYQRAKGELSVRCQEDERLLEVIRVTHKRNYDAYGYRRTWKALLRAGESVPRCQVQRLMRSHGIQGAKRRGKPWRTTKPDPNARRRPDLVNRDFTSEAPNRLWVGDLSYLRCWEGVVYFAFVLDAFSRVRPGRVQPPDRWLAARLAHAHDPGPRRAADGALAASRSWRCPGARRRNGRVPHRSPEGCRLTER
jgi:transposase InsO family protein